MKNNEVNIKKNKDNDLLKINKNEYFVQQPSDLKSALDMGLTEEEFKLICKK